MSAEGEQQRKPGAPDDTDGRRRLRTVSYPDPFLVTKLPLEGTVNSGVIRLGERMLLGFIHRPFPDGTPVRVVYDEWLFAERVDEPEAEQEEDGAEEKRSARGKKSGGGKGRSKDTARSRSAGASKNSGAKANGSKVSRSKATRAGASGAKADAAADAPKSDAAADAPKSDATANAAKADAGANPPKADDEKALNSKADDAKGAQPANETAPARAGENGRHGGAAGGAPAGESEGRSFPEEFIDPESRANRELDSRGDAWTDTFTRRNEEE